MKRDDDKNMQTALLVLGALAFVAVFYIAWWCFGGQRLGKGLASPNSVEDLQTELEACGVDMSVFGVGGARTVKDLFNEITRGRCELVVESLPNGRTAVWRTVRIAQVKIYVDHELSRYNLVEVRETRQQALTAVCAVGEDSLESVKVSLKKMLHLDEEWCAKHARWDPTPTKLTEYSDGKAFGLNYPALKSRYHKLGYSLELLDPAELEECCGFPGKKDFSTVDDLPPRKTRSWTWVCGSIATSLKNDSHALHFSDEVSAWEYADARESVRVGSSV
jgi:hypothetical protein